MLQISADGKTGFPQIKVAGLGSSGLWPVTRVQFERFMADKGRFGDTWYEGLPKLNPRTSYRHIKKSNYEGLFITGITPEEATDYISWLEDGFDLPSIDEWRALYGILQKERLTLSCPEAVSPPAKVIWKALSSVTADPVGFTLMADGLVEWVWKGEGYVGLGKPRHSFHHNTYVPRRDVVTLIDNSHRLYYMGFRLIKRADG